MVLRLKHRALADFQIYVSIVEGESGLRIYDFWQFRHRTLANFQILQLKHKSLANFQILAFVIEAESRLGKDEFLHLKH